MILFRQSAMLHEAKPSQTEGFIFSELSLQNRFGIKKRQILPLLALGACRKQFQNNYDNPQISRCSGQGAEKRQAQNQQWASRLPDM